MTHSTISSLLQSPTQKLVTMRHFRSKAQEFELNLNKMLNAEAWDPSRTLHKGTIDWLRTQYSQEIGHDTFAGLCPDWIEFYKQNRDFYIWLLKSLLSAPLIVQTSPYTRAIHSLALILSDFEEWVAIALHEWQKEYFEFKIDWVPVIVKVNDLLTERNMWNNIFPDVLAWFTPAQREGYNALSLDQKKKLWYYERMDWGESMIDVLVRCKLLLNDFICSWSNQVWVSHGGFLNQLANTTKEGSYHWFVAEDERDYPNWYINIFDLQQHRVKPQLIWYTLPSS